MKTKRENYRYDAVGLPGITLKDIEVSRCPKRGEYEVAIPQIEDLHRTTLKLVARLDPKPLRLGVKISGGRWEAAAA